MGGDQIPAPLPRRLPGREEITTKLASTSPSSGAGPGEEARGRIVVREVGNDGHHYAPVPADTLGDPFKFLAAARWRVCRVPGRLVFCIRMTDPQLGGA